MDAVGQIEARWCIHEYFERQAMAAPDSPALVHGGTTMSYGELNARANALAAHLRGLGVSAESTVGIALGWSIEAIVSILAVMKAGGAYVPIDPNYPRERFAFVLRDSGCRIALTTADVAVRIGEDGPGVTSLVWGSGAHLWDGCPTVNLAVAVADVEPQSLAYVIYTSGSTGTPKGVCVEHGNLAAFLRAAVVAPDCWRRTMLLTSLSFDASVAAVFGPLTTGGCLVVPAPFELFDPEEISALVQRECVDTLLTVPSLVAGLVDWQAEHPASQRLGTLRHVVVGGEPCPPSLVERFIAVAPDEAVLHNAYGPTEATIWATVHDCVPGDGARTVPIGRPSTAARVHLLDGAGRPVEPGEMGEIFIGGPIVARGYLNRPELTAERFVRDPFPLRAAEADCALRMYRTGDCGRWLESGELEFIGRNDSQVKINGFRIELGEVETGLLTHPAIRQAIVVADEDGTGVKRLVAYYTSRGGAITVADLRAHVGARLPRHMVPAVFVEMPAFVLTPNGKLDRKALPPVGRTEEDAAPAGGGDAALLRRMFARMLSQSDVSETSDFFELGGNSLSAMRLASAMRQYGRELPLALLYRARTPQAIARAWQAAPPVAAAGLPTVFVIPGFGGDEPNLAALRADWDARMECVLLEYPDWSVMTDPGFGMAELEAFMVERILSSAPRGPVFLAGYSLGGPLAWAVASRLAGQGVEVGALAILDSIADLAALRAEQRRGLASVRGRLEELKAAFAGADRNAAAKAIAEIVGHRLLGRPWLLRLALRLRRLHLPTMFRQWLHFIVSGGLQERIVSSYLAGGMARLDLPTFLFRAGERGPGEAFNLGWGRLCCNLEVCVVKGDHYTLLNARDEASLFQLLPATLERMRQLRAEAAE